MPELHSYVLPVIDLKGGTVVRGIGGHRAQYRPIKSQFATSSHPADIALGLRSQFGFHDVYVADLNAINGAEPDWHSYEAIASAGLTIWLDAGIPTSHRAQAEFANFGPPHRLIVGLETLPDPSELPRFIEVLGPERAVFSLDLRQGTPLTANQKWDAKTIVLDVLTAGFTSIIILDLASVGSDSGPTTGVLCRQLRDSHPHLEIISGGGVRNEEDVRSLVRSGCNRVLVASALHGGNLSGIRSRRQKTT